MYKYKLIYVFHVFFFFLKTVANSAYCTVLYF